VLVKLRWRSQPDRIILARQNSRVGVRVLRAAWCSTRAASFMTGASAALRDDPERLAKVIGRFGIAADLRRKFVLDTSLCVRHAKPGSSEARKQFRGTPWISPAACLLQIAALAATLPRQQQNRHGAKLSDQNPSASSSAFPAGGPNDILAASSRSGPKARPAVNVENKGGRSGNIATKRSCTQRPMALRCSFAARPTHQRFALSNLPFNFLRDIVPVAGVTAKRW